MSEGLVGTLAGTSEFVAYALSSDHLLKANADVIRG